MELDNGQHLFTLHVKTTCILSVEYIYALSYRLPSPIDKFDWFAIKKTP